MLTHNGWIKKIDMNNFENIRKNGLIAVTLEEGDSLGWVMEAAEADTVFISSHMGMAIRFAVDDLRSMGRTARGVISIKLRTGDQIASMSVLPSVEDPENPSEILFVTNDGYGKRVATSEFRPQARGGIGLISTKFKNRQSLLVSTCVVHEADELMITSTNGVVVRLAASSISRQGRPATGVRIMNMDASDSVSNLTKVVATTIDDIIEGTEADNGGNAE